MTIEQASTFLVGSILTMLGFIIVVGGVVIINNIFHKYWKPVRFLTEDSWTVFGTQPRFASPEELEKK